ncbi:MAG: cyclic nucleotide-binding domain-containing protein [Dehalococcoidia bacterium]
MSIVPLLKKVDILNGLSDSQLEEVAELCREQTFNADDIIFKENDKSSELYLIQDGLVEITLSVPEPGTEKSLVTLGNGQIFGEMALLDEGPRTASARCIADGTRLWVAKRADFISLCEKDTGIGFIVMKNIAADLSFKLRLVNLIRKEPG